MSFVSHLFLKQSFLPVSLHFPPPPTPIFASFILQRFGKYLAYFYSPGASPSFPLLSLVLFRISWSIKSCMRSFISAGPSFLRDFLRQSRCGSSWPLDPCSCRIIYLMRVRGGKYASGEMIRGIRTSWRQG